MIFDINGEYANPNLQDAGTAIFDLYQKKTVRYSLIQKKDFKVMKVNFYNEIETGFELIQRFPAIQDDQTRFISNFRSVSMETPVDISTNPSSKKRYDRRVAVYQCMIYRAQFEEPSNFKVKFDASKEVRDAVDPTVDPSNGLTLDQAANWWEKLWNIYDTNQVFIDYKKASTEKKQ